MGKIYAEPSAEKTEKPIQQPDTAGKQETDQGTSNAAQCEALSEASIDELEGLDLLFGLGLGTGDFRSAVDRADEELPEALGQAFASDTRLVTDAIHDDLTAGEQMRVDGWALIADAEGCSADKQHEALVRKVRGHLETADTAQEQARQGLRASFRLTPESNALIQEEGNLLDDVAAGADWLVEMAVEGDLFWGAFFNGRAQGETSAEAGRRLGAAIAGYPDAVHYLFRVVMQRLPEDRWDHDLLVAALEVNGLTTADFLVSMANWHGVVEAGESEDDALDWHHAIDEIASIKDAFVNSAGKAAARVTEEEAFSKPIHHFHTIRQLPENVKVAQHLTPVAGLIRAHNHMVRYYAALEEVQTAEGGVDQAVFQSMSMHLFDAEAEWVGCSAGVGTLIADEHGFHLDLQEREDPVWSKDGELATDAIDKHVDRVLDEQRAVLTIEAGACSLIASESLGALGSEGLAAQAVAAAGKVDELMKTAGESAVSLGFDGVANVPALPQIIAFYKAAKKLSKSGEVVEEARKAGLVKGTVDTTKALYEVVAACSKAASGGLTALGNGLQKLGDARLSNLGDLEEGAQELSKLDGIRARRAGNRFLTAANHLDKIGAPGDIVSAVAAVLVLIDDDSTSEDVRGASFDLAGAGVGLAATAAEAAGVAGASSLGAGAGLGLAYVKLLSDELARVEGIASASRATTRKVSWDNILGYANRAVKSTARAASASVAFRKSEGATEQKAYARAVMDAQKRQRFLIDQVQKLPAAIDTVSSLRITPDCIGWHEDATQAVRAFEKSGRSGITAVGLSEGADEVKTKDRALANGGLSLFEGVRAAAQTFLAQGERDAG